MRGLSAPSILESYRKNNVDVVSIGLYNHSRETASTNRSSAGTLTLDQKGQTIMNNLRIRLSMTEHNMRQWELARLLDISESVLCRRLRDELPEEEQDRIIAKIEEVFNNDK